MTSSPHLTAWRQIANAVLMVRPTGIRFNSQTAVDNSFQRQILDESRLRFQANEQFERFTGQLRDAGVSIVLVEPPSDIDLPDAVFPNNWISFHEDGTVVTYPMRAANRRLERRPEVIEQVRSSGFIVTSVCDLSNWEGENLFLEGTGSLVLDRVNRLAFAALSPRTHELAVRRWCEAMQYSPICFSAVHRTSGQSHQIYHTNVLMGIGETRSVICLDAIEDNAERQRVRDALASSGRTLIEIDSDQMQQFTGNLLQLRGSGETPVTVVSQTAWNSFNSKQRHSLARGSRVLTAEINAIETCGGGSVRCMLAEIFIPRQSSP